MPFRTSSRRSTIGVHSISPLNMIRPPSHTIFAACSKDTNFSRIAPPQFLSCQPLLSLGFRHPHWRLQSKLIGHGLLDERAFEEVWIVARVQAGGVGERELAEILLGHEALLHQLEGF